jgi:hypothetical protein
MGWSPRLSLVPKLADRRIIGHRLSAQFNAYEPLHAGRWALSGLG